MPDNTIKKVNMKNIDAKDVKKIINSSKPINIINSFENNIEHMNIDLNNMGKVFDDAGKTIKEAFDTVGEFAGNAVESVTKTIDGIINPTDEFWEGTKSEYIDKDGNKLTNAYYVKNSDGTYILKCDEISYKKGNNWVSSGQSLEIKYDTNKQPIERIIYDSNGNKEQRTKYSYSQGVDDSGKKYNDVIKTISSFDKDGNEIFDSSDKERVYEDGRKITLENSYKQNGYNATISFTYDEQGNRKSVSITDADGNIHEGRWEEEGDKINVEYDDGNRTVRFDNSGNNKITFKTESIRDEKGNIVNEKHYYNNWGTEKISSNTDYNSDGSKVETVYNEQGIREKETTFFPGGDITKIEKKFSTNDWTGEENVSESIYYTDGKVNINGTDYSVDEVNQDPYNF